MSASRRKGPRESPMASAEDFTTGKTIALLDELLTHALQLRDSYKSARCQAGDIHVPHLRLLFDTHYKEQLRLVDVLVDRIRALGGPSSVLAGTFLQGAPPFYSPRGHLAPKRLLCALLDAHETVLSAAHAAGKDARAVGKDGMQTDPSADHDFAVRQVVLTNDIQGRSVREQLAGLDQPRRFATTNSSIEVSEG